MRTPLVPKCSVACYCGNYRMSTGMDPLPAEPGWCYFYPVRSVWVVGSMHAAVIADDLTGAADTGVQLMRAGYRTGVAFRGAPIPPAEHLDAVAVDTDSRAMPAGFAAKRVLEAGRAVRDTHIVYKKVDSTLRGPVAAELATALEATGRYRAVGAPALDPKSGV